MCYITHFEVYIVCRTEDQQEQRDVSASSEDTEHCIIHLPAMGWSSGPQDGGAHDQRMNVSLPHQCLGSLASQESLAT